MDWQTVLNQDAVENDYRASAWPQLQECPPWQAFAAKPTDPSWGWCSGSFQPGVDEVWLRWEFPSETTVQGMSLTPRADMPKFVYDSPSTWFVQGSTDKAAWTTLYSKEDELWAPWFGNLGTYGFESPGAYRWYRIVTKNVYGRPGVSGSVGSAHAFISAFRLHPRRSNTGMGCDQRLRQGTPGSDAPRLFWWLPPPVSTRLPLKTKDVSDF